MKDLLRSAADLAELLSPDKIEALSERIRIISPFDDFRQIVDIIKTPSARNALSEMIFKWQKSQITGESLAGILLSASYALQRAQSEVNIELVWTGPTTPFIATRRTDQVLLDLIKNSKENIFISSFVVYDIPNVIREINTASSRGVKIRFLFEASTSDGGTLSIDAISMMRESIPSSELYIWSDRSPRFYNGKVHAKVAIADDHSAFITSANLTSHALEKNMEVGVLISGGRIPISLSSHFTALIDTKVITKFQAMK